MAKIKNTFGKLTIGKKLSPTDVLDGVQGVIDFAGFAPGIVGPAFDLGNAGIYYLRGDKVNAGLSAYSALPGVGDTAAAAKIANKGLKTSKKLQKTSEKSKKVSEIDAQSPLKAKVKEIIDNVKKDWDDSINKQLDEMQKQMASCKDSQIKTFDNLTKGLEGQIKNSQELMQNVQSQLGTYTKFNNTYGNIMKPRL